MKLWGGRFEKKTDGLVDDFHSSITFDKRLYHQDIAGSIAHATMLGDQGIITKQTRTRSSMDWRALKRISQRVRSRSRWTRRIST